MVGGYFFGGCTEKPSSTHKQEQPVNHIAGLRRIHPAIHHNGVPVIGDCLKELAKEWEHLKQFAKIPDINFRTPSIRIEKREDVSLVLAQLTLFPFHII